ncbi:tRNA (adenosine(37)-N6)-threonylcarbamoyltransferase complex ATPase subunit type 1 TsaE [Neoehrlichia mikurensis]|nr:tRNA (adenosine(37)-N6)-threonylcarbamoyltransferase complex ATPase subunit type 1 TsaE [Neoehrlichia mikurensis]QXK93232.1 tRNA (adenosine(37)-N6)-threonylcarbamoyltransferase complex ATPase subunit type 1 TsaE [Neoehrlichia mikurensis]QXK94077.1 tRNA (adenosine(37)-N6)-threonylcarbamoyltransferase complex ATPase subunit type 1 TsaE [Neoehrlichia mikurensis]
MLTYSSVDINFIKILSSKIAANLTKGDVLFLTGDLGVGKTTISRFIINYFLPNEDVYSPTFSLVNEYQCSIFNIYHADFFRLKTIDEIYEIGILEMAMDNVSIIEWPELVYNILRFSLHVNIQYSSKKENQRNITMQCNQYWYTSLKK